MGGEHSQNAGALRERSQTIFDKIVKVHVNKAHASVKPIILERWSPVYEQCSYETGKSLRSINGCNGAPSFIYANSPNLGPGHYRRNQVTHMKHIQSTGVAMYQECTKKIRAIFRKLWTKVQRESDEGTNKVLSQIKEEFLLLLGNHTIRDDEAGDENEIVAKAILQQEILEIFEKLNCAWCEKVEFIKEDVDVKIQVEEDDEINVDALINSQDNDDDELDNLFEDE